MSKTKDQLIDKQSSFDPLEVNHYKIIFPKLPPNVVEINSVNGTEFVAHVLGMQVWGQFNTELEDARPGQQNITDLQVEELVTTAFEGVPIADSGNIFDILNNLIYERLDGYFEPPDPVPFDDGKDYT